MLEIIALLAPSMMALGFYSHLHRDKIQVRKLISSYGLFVIIINLCMYMIMVYLLGHDQVVFTAKVFIKYLISASVFALLLPFVVNLIENIVAVEVRKNGKK